MTTEQISSQNEELLEVNYSLSSSPRSFLKSADVAYYRSKIFATENSINPLMNAAAPLFTLASKIKALKNSPNLPQLHHDLCHEIKAFETKVQDKEYASYTLLAARYILCAFLDESILTTAWGKESHWQDKNLLTHFHHENDQGEKFFMLLERATEDSKSHVDLLELMYCCLSLDYQGKYRQIEQGAQELAEMMDQLYKLICVQRGEFTTRFTLSPDTHDKMQRTNSSLTPIITAVTSTCLSLAIVYSGFNYALSIQAHHFYQTLEQLKSLPGIFS